MSQLGFFRHMVTVKLVAAYLELKASFMLANNRMKYLLLAIIGGVGFFSEGFSLDKIGT